MGASPVKSSRLVLRRQRSLTVRFLACAAPFLAFSWAWLTARPSILRKAPPQPTLKGHSLMRRHELPLGTGTSTKALGQCWSQYTWALAAWPLPTKALTSALLASFGDLLAQLVSCKQEEFPRGQRIDFTRLARFAAVNGLLVGPTFHLWYGWLGEHIVSGTALKGALLRVLLDQLVFSPLFLFVFLMTIRSLASSPMTLATPPPRLWCKLDSAPSDSVCKLLDGSIVLPGALQQCHSSLHECRDVFLDGK